MSRGGVGGAGGGGGRGGVGRGLADGSRWGGVLLAPPVPLPLVDLGVPLALIAAGKLASTLTTGEWFLTSVCSNVCGQVVTAAEATHADAALEGLLTRVHAHVARQFI